MSQYIAAVEMKIKNNNLAKLFAYIVWHYERIMTFTLILHLIYLSFFLINVSGFNFSNTTYKMIVQVGYIAKEYFHVLRLLLQEIILTIVFIDINKNERIIRSTHVGHAL